MSAVRRADIDSIAMRRPRIIDDESNGATVYHVGPWRYLWLPFLFGPLALGCALLAIGAEPDERGALWAGAGCFVLVLAFILALVRAAR